MDQLQQEQASMLCQMAASLCNDASNLYMRQRNFTDALVLYNQSLSLLQTISVVMDEGDFDLIKNETMMKSISTALRTSASSSSLSTQSTSQIKSTTTSYSFSMDTSAKQPAMIHFHHQGTKINTTSSTKETPSTSCATAFHFIPSSFTKKGNNTPRVDHPLSVIVLYNLGLLYMEMNEFQKALEVWELIDDLCYLDDEEFPREFHAVVSLKIGYSQLKVYGSNCEMGWNHLSNAVQLVSLDNQQHPNNSTRNNTDNGIDGPDLHQRQLYGSICGCLGWIFMECGRVQEARFAFDSAVFAFNHFQEKPQQADISEEEDQSYFNNTAGPAPAA